MMHDARLRRAEYRLAFFPLAGTDAFGHEQYGERGSNVGIGSGPVLRMVGKRIVQTIASQQAVTIAEEPFDSRLHFVSVRWRLVVQLGQAIDGVDSYSRLRVLVSL